MDQSYIIPVIKSVQNVFETMLQLPIEVGTPERKHGGDTGHDVSAIVGLSGDMDGAVVLSFPTETAERVVALFTGTELDAGHEDFADALGELVSMVAGGAKAQFNCQEVSISCPTVVIGRGHQVHARKDVVAVSIPCGSDCGRFYAEVSIRQLAGSPAAK